MAKVWYDYPGDFINFYQINFLHLNILIGSKPDSVGVTRNFAESIDTWVSVSDKFIDIIPEWNPRMFWHPLTDNSWDIGSFFWFKKIMDRELLENKPKKIYVHCGLGVVRSPLMVLHWLLSHISTDEASLFFSSKKDVLRNLVSFEKSGKCPSRETLDMLYYKMQEDKNLGINNC